MIARLFFNGVDNRRFSLAAALFAALFCLSWPVLHGEDKKDEKKDDQKEHIAQLAKDFKSSTPKGKGVIIEKLAKLGEGAARPLCDAMLDKDDEVATLALVSLEKAHPKLHKPVATLVLDRDPKVQAKSLEELGAMGSDAKPALGLLVARGKSAVAAADQEKTDSGQTALYMRAIPQIGPEEPETVAFFKEAVRSNHSKIWHDALTWLVSWAGDKEARRKELMPIVKAGLVDVPGAVPFIETAGKYHGLAKECLPALKKLKLSNTAAVREAATAAVEAIEKP